MGSDDWEATWDARLAALPADEEKYGWYAKLGEIVELNKSAGDEAADPDLYENVKKGLTGGEGHPAIVRDYGPRSRQIAAAIKNLTETSGRAAVQKAEMKSLKLDDLLVAAEAALPITVSCCRPSATTSRSSIRWSSSSVPRSRPRRARRTRS